MRGGRGISDKKIKGENKPISYPSPLIPPIFPSMLRKGDKGRGISVLEIYQLDYICNILIPYFDKIQFRTKKYLDYVDFRTFFFTLPSAGLRPRPGCRRSAASTPPSPAQPQPQPSYEGGAGAGGVGPLRLAPPPSQPQPQPSYEGGAGAGGCRRSALAPPPSDEGGCRRFAASTPALR